MLAWRLRHLPALDGLRGIAVLAVLWTHSNVFGPNGGFLGVDLFFVLSGFLITALLVREWADFGRVDLWAFYARRGLRLFPAVIALHVVLWAAVLAARDPFGWGLDQLAWSTAATLGYVRNWLMIAAFKAPAPTGHTWSLAVEEQFYILWPALLLAALRYQRPFRAALGLALGLAAASALWRAALSLGGASPFRTHAGTDTHADGILLGCALAVAFSRWGLPSARARRAAGVAGAGLFAVLLMTADPDARWLTIVGFGLAAVASAGLIVGALDPSPLARAVLTWRPLVEVGRISYGLYLWHWPVMWLLAQSPSASALSAPALFVVEMGVSVGVAILSYVVVERPALRLKARYRRPPLGRAATGVGARA